MSTKLNTEEVETQPITADEEATLIGVSLSFPDAENHYALTEEDALANEKSAKYAEEHDGLEETLTSLATQQGESLWIVDRNEIKTNRPADFKNIQKMMTKFKKVVKYQQHNRVMTKRKNTANPTSTYTTHHITEVKNLERLKDSLRAVYEVYCMRKPTKMAIMFSYLTETEHRNADGTTTYTHEITEGATDTFFAKGLLPQVIHNPETLELFVKYAIGQLGELLERTQKDTKTHILCILEAFVTCYDLTPVGSATLRMNCEFKICIFIALSFLLYPENMSNQKRTSLASYLCCEFYEITGSWKVKRKFLLAYPGFNFTTEIVPFAKFFSTNIQTFVEQDKCVVYGDRYECDDPTLTLNLYITDDQCLFVKDPSKLTKCQSCPKCHMHWEDVSDKHRAAKLRDHIKFCTGKPREKQLKLKDSFEYAPQYQKNRAYKFMVAHGLGAYYKPLHNYATFDLETVETRINEKVGKSEILSSLTTLSVSSAFNCPGLQNVSIYYDCRNGANFMHQWLAELFEKAKTIAEANKYTKDDWPLEALDPLGHVIDGDTVDKINDMIHWREVPVLGFNSARFDMNLFLNELDCEEWHIYSHRDCMISERNMRMIKVISSKSRITLVFKDVMHFIAGGTLDSFCKDFGKGMVKSFFPYEAFDSENFNEYLSKSPAEVPREKFFSTLKNEEMNTSDYQTFQQKRCKNHD
ncbi:hypothetical protein FACS189472_11390 [Alphaproteobacteria bacterium]|nr:hypothetical protein FACS189472_11390 [Alphaproteobacteria bacterium]